MQATINLSVENIGCTVADQDAPVTILEGTAITLTSNSGYTTYEWTNSSGELLSNSSSFSISPEETDVYNLSVTFASSSGNTCVGYCFLEVAVGVLPVDAISPNGDGWNDDWYIEDLQKYPNSTVQLFTRWGDMLFEYKGSGDRITNNDYDWTTLDIGTYYYIIDLDNGSSPQTGPLTIIK